MAWRKPDVDLLRKHVSFKPWERLAPGMALVGVGLALTRLEYSLTSTVTAQIAGWAIVCGGDVALTIGLLTVIRQHTKYWQSRVTSYLHARFDATFERINCTSDDVRTACSVGAEVVGDVCPTFANVLPRFDKNHDIVRCYRRRRGKKTEMCAYFILYPLTKAADAAILSGMIRSGPMIKAEHISKMFTRCSALYIAMIYGADSSARGFVQFQIIEFIESVVLHNTKVSRVYGNPTTLDGARLLNQYGFVPVGDDSPLLVAHVR